ncbi:MAG: phosphomannomutase, partial [halophilic archaeon J07HX5]
MELFGTAGIRGPVSEIDPSLALSVGQVIGADADEVVIARDGRETGAALAAAVEAGVASGGATPVRAGQLPTPALAFASGGRYGVMLTASHNPPADNGIKLFRDGHELDQSAEQRVERRVEAPPTASWDGWGRPRQSRWLSEYRTAVVEYARDHGDPADGLRVAVDCGNGVASLATPQVLERLGANVDALNANLDGQFPGRASKPTAESLTDLRAYVADGETTLGIGLDGDADRLVIIDETGTVVHEDTVLAILAEHYTRRSTAGEPVVVTTPNASGRIDERVTAAGGRVERVGLGALHEGIARVRSRSGSETSVVFAAEPWKHIHPAHGGWIDGVASAAVLVRLAAATGVATLRAPVAEPPYRKESVACPDGQKSAAMERLEERLPAAYDGT